MSSKATVTLFLGSGFLTGWIAQCPVSDGGSREEGKGKASEDAARGERPDGERTTESAKGSVISPPPTPPKLKKTARILPSYVSLRDF